MHDSLDDVLNMHSVSYKTVSHTSDLSLNFQEGQKGLLSFLLDSIFLGKSEEVQRSIVNQKRVFLQLYARDVSHKYLE